MIDAYAMPGPWRPARWATGGLWRLQFRERPDGDVDVRELRRDEFGRQVWSKAERCPAAYWRAEGVVDEVGELSMTDAELEDAVLEWLRAKPNGDPWDDYWTALYGLDVRSPAAIGVLTSIVRTLLGPHAFVRLYVDGVWRVKIDDGPSTCGQGHDEVAALWSVLEKFR